MKYNIKMSRTFKFTAHSVEAASAEEAVEKAWEYLDEGKVKFEEIVGKVVSIESDGKTVSEEDYDDHALDEENEEL